MGAVGADPTRYATTYTGTVQSGVAHLVAKLDLAYPVENCTRSTIPVPVSNFSAEAV